MWKEEDAYYPLLRFLNEMETISTEVRAGTVDMQFAYSSHYEGITKNFVVYENAIKRFRRIYNSEDIFAEWQRLA